MLATAIDPAIAAAIIAALATISAAIIGLFTHIRKPKQETSSQSAIAAGHVLQASHGATQNVFLSPAPARDPENERSKLIALAEQTLEIANESLVENQKILSPLLVSGRFDRYTIARELGRLFEEQRHRGFFGKSEAFYAAFAAREKDPQVRAIVEDLLACVRTLSDAFYSYDRARDAHAKMTGSKKRYPIIKNFVEAVLSGRAGLGEIWVPDEEASQIARSYLDSLRGTVARIGSATGKLKALGGNPGGRST